MVTDDQYLKLQNEVRYQQRKLDRLEKSKKLSEEMWDRNSNLFQKLTDELREALEKVKTLKSLIPICASCKKVRNDSGYWEQVEGYISEHTGSVFSHGLCPECLQDAFSELNNIS